MLNNTSCCIGKTQVIKAGLSTQKPMFHSAWLCSSSLTDQIRPVMDCMVNIEARDNNNYTNSFLPHVTLFSGENLLPQECEAMMDLFFEDHQNGISLEITHFIEKPRQNPPVQLLFRASTLEDQVLLNQFKSKVTQTIGKNINMNNNWLHATLLYKTVPQPMMQSSLLEARTASQKMIGTHINFNQYAVTTGKAWIPEDIACWSHVNAKTFRNIR